MIQPLPGAFLGAPIAHRALHDRLKGRPENSRAAIRAAVAAGYGIEIDLQVSADGQALVFHDADLTRLTGRCGPVRGLSARQAGAVALLDGDGEGIPTLGEVLGIVAGRVALLIEIKDQARAGGPGIGPLESAAARALDGYGGPVAVMSFNPDSVAEMARIAPGCLPRTSAISTPVNPFNRSSTTSRCSGVSLARSRRTFRASSRCSATSSGEASPEAISNASSSGSAGFRRR